MYKPVSNSMSDFSIFKSKVFLASLVVLGAILLVPHGMGVRLYIGHLDLPRLSILITIGLGAVLYFRQWFTAGKIICPPGSISIITLMTCIAISVLISSNIIASLILALQLMAMWFLFPLAFIKLFRDDIDGVILNSSLIVVINNLFGVIMIEVLTQKYLVSPELRTRYYG
ncbi:MAG: hypothetical protein J4F41_06925, partial [Alphaproteobacteria bacterium]|nr:hypothetical protein [Alphaproteobacteria bacterium]